jgi:hypothetical protein
MCTGGPYSKTMNNICLQLYSLEFSVYSVARWYTVRHSTEPILGSKTWNQRFWYFLLSLQCGLFLFLSAKMWWWHCINTCHLKYCNRKSPVWLCDTWNWNKQGTGIWPDLLKTNGVTFEWLTYLFSHSSHAFGEMPVLATSMGCTSQLYCAGAQGFCYTNQLSLMEAWLNG